MWPRLFLVLAGLALLARPGWAGEGAVALQTADTSCRTTTTPPPRYVDCGNGTVTDNKTGLVWLKKATCWEKMSWSEAVEFVANLSDVPAASEAAAHDCGLADGSSPGEWRLPSIDEWEVMVEEAVALGCAPTITNDQGDGCWFSNFVCVAVGRTCSFINVPNSSYWSSTTDQTDLALRWRMDITSGNGDTLDKSLGLFVWPVRGGQ